jgi:hypothetical protein
MNDTNNPIETINNVLKQFIPNAGSIIQCLKGIFDLVAYLENGYNHNNYKNGKLTKYQGMNDLTVDQNEFYKVGLFLFTIPITVNLMFKNVRVFF